MKEVKFNKFLFFLILDFGFTGFSDTTTTTNNNNNNNNNNSQNQQ